MFKYLLILLPACLLFHLIRFGFLGIPTNVLEIYIGVLFVWWILQRNWKIPTSARPAFWSAVLFVIASLIALITTILTIRPEFQNVPLGIVKGWIIVPVLVFVMFITTIRTRNDLDMLIRAFIFSAGIYSLLALSDYFLGVLPLEAATYDHRLVWPFFDPVTGEAASANYPAMLLGPILVLGMCFTPLKPWRSVFGLAWISSVLLIAAAIYLTQSFSAWIAIAGAMTIFGFLRIRSGRKWWVPVMAVIMAITFFISQINSEKFQWALKTDADSSTAERIRIYTVAFDMLMSHPFAGVGIGQFQNQFSLNAPEVLGRAISQKEIDHALHAHNLFLMIYLSFGILGFVSFIYLLWKLFCNNPPGLSVKLMIPLLTILIHGLFDTPYFKYDLAVEFWLLAAMIVIAKSIPYSIPVKTVKGLGIAKTLGFPTINLELPKKTALPYGVYTASLISESKKYPGVLGFGKRLTQGINEETCEIHLFEAKEMGTEPITLEVGPKIRGWRKFRSMDILKKMVHSDIQKAKALS